MAFNQENTAIFATLGSDFSGNSIRSGREGEFEVQQFDFDFFHNLTFAGESNQSIYSRSVTMDPIFLDLKANAFGSSHTLEHVLSGDLIGEDVVITFQYDDGGPLGNVLQTITLENASIISYDTSSSSNDRIALNFETIEIETFRFDPFSGANSGSEIFSYDLVMSGGEINKDLDTLQSRFDPVTENGTTNPTFMDIVIAGENVLGGATQNGFEGQFNVLSYDFDFESVRFEASTQTSINTEPVLSQIVVDFNTEQAGILDLLQKDKTAVDFFETLTLTSIKDIGNGNSEVFETIELTNVVPTYFEFSTATSGRIAFQYEEIDFEQRYYDSLGNLEDTFSFNRNVNISGGSFAEYDPSNTSAPQVANENYDIFWDADIITGNSSDSEFINQFEVLGFDFDVLKAPPIGNGSPLYSTPVLTPIVLDISPNDPGVLNLQQTMLDNGLLGSQSTFSFRNDNGDLFKTVTLVNPEILQFNERSGYESKIALAFDTIKIDFLDYDDEGPAFESSFQQIARSRDGDRVINHIDASNISTEPELEAPSIQDMFLQFSTENNIDLIGSSTSEGFKGAFDVLNYEFDFSSIIDTDNNHDNIEVSPFFIDVSPVSGGVGFYNAFQEGTSFNDVELSLRQPVPGGSKAGDTIAEISLGDVRIISVAEQSGFATRIGLDFDTIDYSRNIFNEFTGQPTGEETSLNLDLSKSSALIRPSSEEHFSPEVEIELGNTFHLDLGEIKGNSTDVGFEDQFDVLAYALDIDKVTPFDSNYIISPLVIDVLPGQTGIASMITALTNSTLLPTVTLNSFNEATQSGQTITLTEAFILDYQEASGRASRVSFEYHDIEITPYTIDSAGDTINGTSYSHSEITNLPKPAFSESGADAEVLTPPTLLDFNTDIFLNISPDANTEDDNFGRPQIKGDSQNSAHLDEFEVLSYEFDIAAASRLANSSLNARRNIANSESRVDLAPLIVEIAAGQAGITELLEKTVGDQSGGRIQIPEMVLSIATNAGAGEPLDFQIMVFKNVTVLGIDSNGFESVKLTFGYSQFEITINNIENTGQLSQNPVEVDFAFDDDIQGTLGNDNVDGGKGNDKIFANDGDDTVDGGEGDDQIDAGSGRGFDTYYGGEGNDTITFRSTTLGIVVDLSAEQDHAQGTEIDTDQIFEIENIVAGDGDDDLTGDEHNNRITGGKGADTINGMAGDDEFVFLSADPNVDQIDGGDGSDTADFESFNFAIWADLQFSGDEFYHRNGQTVRSGIWEGVANSSGIENITTSRFADDVNGNSDSNTFKYVDNIGGFDRFNGRDGQDTADYSKSDSAVWVDLSYIGVEGWTRNGADVQSGTWEKISNLVSVENLTASRFADELYGDAGDNVFGYTDNEIANGQFDLFNGRGGDDTADFSKSSAAVWVDLTFNGVEAWTRDGEDVLSGDWREIARVDNIENLVASAFRDELYGTADDNTFVYTDNQSGFGAYDVFDGRGGLFDVSDFSQSSTAVWVDLALDAGEAWTRGGATLSTGDWEQIVDLRNIEGLVASGFADQLLGTNSGSENFIYTDNQSDFDAYDRYDGRGGFDFVDFSQSSSAVWVNLGYNGVDAWTRGGEDLSSGDWEKIADIRNIDAVRGSNFADELFGDSDDNELYGSLGNDTLTGAGGSDEFVFLTALWGDDTILDFEIGSDMIGFYEIDGLNDFADLTITNNGSGNATISYGSSSVTFNGIDESALNDTDFLFG